MGSLSLPDDIRYKEFIVERPLVGYGMTPPSFEWPNGAKIAINFVIQYHEGAESSVEYGDKESEVLFHDLGTISSRNTRDDMTEAETEYGPRAGLPRLLRLFKQFGYTATVDAVSAALEKSPYWGKELVDARFEIACASKRWINYMDVAPEEEEKHIAEAISSLEKLTGAVPRGYCTGRRSNLSQRLYTRAAHERGVKNIYSADSFGDDLPYWVVSPLAEEGVEDHGLLIIPSSLDCSDWRFNATAVGFSSGEDFYRHLVDTFDTLYAEGEQGQPKLMNVSLHPRIIGRAGRLHYLRRFMKYVAEKEAVWVAQRQEVADFWAKTFPYQADTAHGKLPTPGPSPAELPSLDKPVAENEYKVFLPPRDFTAYGKDTPANCWPNGAKIAVSFVLNVEEGAEHTLWNGDSAVDTHSEAFLNEAACHRGAYEGRRDLYVESLYEYGMRAGLPRVLKIFQEFGWSFSTWMNARALEAASYYGPHFVAGGHDIAAHGNRWITQTELSGPEEEARHVAQAIDRLRAATGLQDVPTGWYYGRGTLYNKHILAKVHRDKGVPLLYSSDTYADDVPYYVEHPFTLDGEEDEGLLMIPYSLTNNDHRFYTRGAGFSSADDFFDLLKAEFDEMLEEGRAGQPKMMTIALHSRIIGRPGRITAIRRFMEYVQKSDEAWVTTRDKIAHHWREHFPYQGPTRTLHQ